VFHVKHPPIALLSGYVSLPAATEAGPDLKERIPTCLEAGY
jgi:hypothetical protein